MPGACPHNLPSYALHGMFCYYGQHYFAFINRGGVEEAEQVRGHPMCGGNLICCVVVVVGARWNRSEVVCTAMLCDAGSFAAERVKLAQPVPCAGLSWLLVAVPPNEVVCRRVRTYRGRLRGVAPSHVAASLLQEWVMFDDATVSTIGSWSAVISKCRVGRIQPSVLFYQTHKARLGYR